MVLDEMICFAFELLSLLRIMELKRPFSYAVITWRVLKPKPKSCSKMAMSLPTTAARKTKNWLKPVVLNKAVDLFALCLNDHDTCKNPYSLSPACFFDSLPLFETQQTEQILDRSVRIYFDSEG